MKRKSLLFLLLFALIAPWAANAQTRETLTFNFEDQTIPSAWTNDATYPWVVTNAAANAGSYSIKSGNSQQNSTTSTITATYTFVAEGSISFAARCSSEQNTPSYDWDYGTFYIDNVQQGDKIINSSTFSNYSYELAAGEHTFMWKYKKDGSVSNYDDCLYVDDVVIDLGVAGALPKPTNLACQLTPGNGTIATLSWTENGTATAWEIMLNNDETNLIPANSNPFTLTNLTPETSYTACVRAIDGTNQSSWSSAVSFKPTYAVSLIVNDGTATNGYVPIYGYWCDNITKSQFIIPADNLTDMENGTITQMTFFGTMTGTSATWGAAKFEVYMAETAETTLSALADYTTMDIVMNAASISIVNGEMVVVFDTPYEYMGGNLMIGFLQTVSGQFSACSWTGVTATGASMGGYGTTFTQQNFLPKIKFAYLPGAAPTCPKPTGLTVGTITGRTAELSWTEKGEATAWQICLNGDEANLIAANSNPFILTGLTPETAYTAKVRAYCDAEDQSDWSSEISFRTDVACPAPTNLAVNATPNSATVTWTGTASEYEMQYATAGGILQYGFEEDLQGWTNLIVNEDGGEWLHSSNNQAGYDYTEVAHTGTGFAMCFSYVDPEDKSYDPGAYNTDAYLVSPMAYQINAGASLNFWYDMANDNYPEYFEVCVATVANPTASDFTAIWTLPVEEEDEKTGRHEQVRHLDRTRYDNWREVTIDLSDYVGQTIWIAFHDVNEDMYELWLDDVTVNDGNEVTWIPIPGYVTSPYTWEPLDPETSYMVRVRAICGGEDGESIWTTTSFTTPSNCTAPFALTVPNATLMPESATLAWTGYQESYQVRYRTPAHTEVFFFENFENTQDNALPAGWTSIDADGDGQTWYSINQESFAQYAHSGQGIATSASYASSGALTPDNWLVTPQLALKGTMKVWMRAQDPSWAQEHYAIYLSTAGNTVADFTTTLVAESDDLSGEYLELTADLSSYNGQLGYIAIRHFNCTDMFRINVDDFGIYGEEVAASEWITVTVNDTLAPIDRLDPETEYEWQVMGLNCSGTNNTEWSEIATFTTPSYCDNPNHIVFDELTATSATISWTGYQDSYNVWYRTAAVEEFFYEDFSGSIAGWMTANANSNSGFYDLGEGDDGYTAFGFVGDGNAQTLISPTIEGIVSGSTLSFLYYDYSQGATPQTFSVGFATVDEITSLAQFTFGETYTTSTEDYINYYEIEVPEGAKHFAIQCTSGSGSYLFVTDFWIYGPNYQAPGEFVQMVVETNSATLAPLTAETEYEVYVQGICGEGEEDVTYWVGGSFWTPEQTNITQTITLAQGTNWVSFYVNTNLDALKAALETTGLSPITIKAKNDGQTTYNGARWRGALNTLDFAQMYKIDVPEDCEISLEGMPLDASQITITIKTGDNWIGFPFAQNMTVTEAFASIAINTDAVRSKDGGQATYNGSRWRGALSTLVPGQGYIYRSAVLEDTPFVYPTSSKRNAQNETAVLSSHKMTTRNKSFKAVSSFKALSTSKVNQNPTIK